MEAQEFKQQEMVEISLSFFDLVLGPRLIASLPWVTETTQSHFVSEFFDFHEDGDFFTHIFKDFLSFNHLFSIANPANIRGGRRLLMLSASVPFSLLKRKDILQYYISIENLFREWAKDIEQKPSINAAIKDGSIQQHSGPGPILRCLSNYLGELEFILNVMPDTVAIPIEKLPQSMRS